MTPINQTELWAQVQKLPALSTIVTELLSTIDQADIDIDSIAEKISCDQTLTVKLLRLANSSFYGMQHKISSTREAINILGFKNVRMMVASSAITGSIASTKIKNFSFRSFWLHSIGTAICAQEIAAHAGANQEFAFITGLIHDIGRLVLVTHYPDQYESVLGNQIQQRCELETAELQQLGIDHSEISKLVLNYWKFPQAMQIAVSSSQPDSTCAPVELAEIIHIADIFSLALDFADDEHVIIPKISTLAWNKLKLDEPTCRKIFANATSKFSDISQILLG